jgi:hypothetical protein
MLQWKHACLALLCLTANAALAQHRAMTTGIVSESTLQESDLETPDNNQWLNDSNELWMKSMVSLPQARARLAAEWQHLGVSAKDAKVIASAYRPDDAERFQHAPLRGKSDTEIASMLQSALVAKNYRLANLLLIDYERLNVRRDPSDTAMLGK